MRATFLSSLLIGMSIVSTNLYADYSKIDKQSFNQLAQELNVPIFWREDSNQNNKVDPNELVYLWGLRPDKNLENYVSGGKFTKEFHDVYHQMLKRKANQGQSKGQDEESLRRALVVKELAQARPTLLESDFSNDSLENKTIVKHILKTAYLIDQLYLKQNGVYGWDAEIPVDDSASKTLFYRNHGPFCLNPATENNPDCSALPSKPKRIVDVYPASLQANKTFCEVIQSDPNATTLIKPFTAVTLLDGQLSTVPYAERYQADMQLIAAELKATAAAVTDPKETPFKTYLLAAAQAFEDNNWYAADAAWAKMNATNSKWYLRVGPDEQYWEPCNLKAGFHLSFATINELSLEWQSKLDPLKHEMEGVLAELAGPPYQAREVNFHLPDFIDIVLNAGDSRSHSGGTIGQSLPNSGPIADAGVGRTVVMANMTFPDEDSKKISLAVSASLFCSATMQLVVADSKVDNISTVLHEAAHNLGPSREYKVDGKIDSAVFGGQMASMLEELKAQTSALYFVNWLVKKGMLEQKLADQIYLADLRWSFGHIARGMYTSEGSYKTYSQLAGIQFGTFIKSGAVVWNPEEVAANGKDVGCFSVDLDKYRATVVDLEKQVLQIKAKGDKPSAEIMRNTLIDEDQNLKKLRDIISERVLRTPNATFVYSIKH